MTVAVLAALVGAKMVVAVETTKYEVCHNFNKGSSSSKKKNKCKCEKCN